MHTLIWAFSTSYDSNSAEIQILIKAPQIVWFCFNFTLQCANIGPADYNYDETISTLRYANRAKNIKNKARINEDPKDALLRQFQKEIEELKKKLEEGTTPQFHNVFMSELVSRMWLIGYGAAQLST